MIKLFIISQKIVDKIVKRDLFKKEGFYRILLELNIY